MHGRPITSESLTWKQWGLGSPPVVCERGAGKVCGHVWPRLPAAPWRSGDIGGEEPTSTPSRRLMGSLAHRKSPDEPKDHVRSRTPIPEREWTPDEEEVYVSEFDPTANVYEDEDVEMGGHDEPAGDEA
ncbi:hypothetical protein FRC12_000979 [Ceratobasidium sp. 428]|nr:hypothetical protein FRC12_000979 [Ceratobasidium sp. 428]